MKTTLLFNLLFFCATTFSIGQYTINWSEAPLNPIPEKYTLNHFNLRGNVVMYELVLASSIYYFNKNGLDSKVGFIGTTAYTYNNGHIEKSEFSGGMGNVVTYKTNANGFVSHIMYDSEYGLKYEYNAKKLLVKRINIPSNLPSTIYTYDKNNRLIEENRYDYKTGKVADIVSYTYIQKGANLEVVISTKNIADSTVKKEIQRFNDKGYVIFKDNRSITYTFDQYGNPLTQNGDLLPAKYKYSYATTQNNNFAEVIATKKNVVTNTSTPNCTGNCQNGYGTKYYGNDYYQGFWNNGKKEGYGIYLWNGVGKYIGNWENDTMSGYGEYLAENKDNIIGIYKNGQLNGIGYSVLNDVWEQGIYSNGKLIDRMAFIDLGTSTGCVAGNCQNGYGQTKWSNGDMFTGFYKNGKLVLGTYIFANGDKYYGEFQNNAITGFGRYFYVNGDFYNGNFNNGKFDGLGYYSIKTSNKIDAGKWSNGTLVTKMN